ncbi:DUF6197 family protein [Streptomyces sp. NPDC004082]
MTTVSALSRFTEADIAAAAELAATGSFWIGLSGETATGEQVARHLEAALAALSERGWTRLPVDDPQVPEVDEAESVKALLLIVLRWMRGSTVDTGPVTLLGALSLAQQSAGDQDTRAVAGQVMNALLSVRTGAVYADHYAWAEKQGRTHDQVRDLLEASARFARQYGPSTAAA